MAPLPPLASDWYAERLGSGLEPLDAALARAHPAWLLRLARALGPLRGLLVFRLAARRGVAIVYREPGVATLLALSALRRRRAPAIVLLEFIPRYVSSLGPLYRAWRALVLRPALRRAPALAQVLSEHERRRYASEFGLPAARLACVRWPLGTGEPPAPGSRSERRGVLASGRAWCDWPTLFAAAAPGWDLTVVCSRRDLRRVRALNRDRVARVLCEIPRDEHDRLLRDARVLVVPIPARAPSAGQVRLRHATDAGTPVIVSRVPALADYADERSALLVEPGDPAALRAAVRRLLEAPELGERLAAERRRRAAGWGEGEYFAAVAALVDRGLRRERPDA